MEAHVLRRGGPRVPIGAPRARCRAPRVRCGTPRILAVLALALLLVGGCDLLVDPVVCTGEVVPGVVVMVTDAETGAAVAFEATGRVQDGTYVDELSPYERSGGDLSTLYSFRGADERPGTYEVFVEREGYAPWSTTGVRVTAGVCHVRTVRVQAELTPLGGS
jgi:hypothetical protein